MNREIKFRAWHKKRETMCHFDIMTVTKTYHPGYWHTPDLDGFDCELDDSMLYSELMQYTGLKDKNDKEIYEGDIVRCESNYIRLQTSEPTGKKSIKFYEVVWHEVMFTTKRMDNGHICPLATSPSIWKSYYEVIDNIYENPELLEGGK